MVSLSRKHFHDMGEWDDPPLRFKVKGYNVSYVRYMQVWSLRGMGVCSGRCVEARIWGMRVCRSVILVARSYPTPHLTEILRCVFGFVRRHYLLERAGTRVRTRVCTV